MWVGWRAECGRQKDWKWMGMRMGRFVAVEGFLALPWMVSPEYLKCTTSGERKEEGEREKKERGERK